MDSLLLTAQQVGERYGLHRNTLYAWEQQGLLHPVRTPGGRRRYRRDEIERLLTLEPQPVQAPHRAVRPGEHPEAGTLPPGPGSPSGGLCQGARLGLRGGQRGQREPRC